MGNVNQRVWKILEGDLAIKKNLSRKVINTRALARQLIEDYNLKASIDAVISAIRRFETQGQYEKHDTLVQNVLQNSLVRTRTNITCLTIHMKPREFLEKLKNVDMNIPGTRILTGSYAVKFIVINEKVPQFRKLFGNKIVAEAAGLAEVKVELGKEAVKTKGVLARIATEISLQDINLVEFVMCPPELLMYVHETDLVSTHKTMVELTRR